MKLIIKITLLFFCALTLNAQNLVQFSPANGATNVPLMPNIFIKTKFTIDSNTVARQDTNTYTRHFPNLSDNIILNPEDPTIMLVPQILIDSLGGTLDTALPNYKRLLTAKFSYTRINDTTLLIVPTKPLAPGTVYRLLVSNLKLIEFYAPGNSHDTISITNESMSFTTAPPVQNLVFYTGQFKNEKYSKVRCQDSLVFKFSRNLNSLSTISGNIFELYKNEPVQIIGDSIANNNIFSSASFTAYIKNGDSSLVFLKPNGGFTPGEKYKVKVNSSFLNGDTLTDKVIDYQGVNKYKLTLKIAGIDSVDINNSKSFTFPVVGTRNIRFNDSIPIFANKINGNYLFQKWTSNYTPFNGISELRLPDLSFNCQDFQDIEVTANYVKIDSIEVDVRDSFNVTCKVFNSAMNYLGGAGKYKIYKDESLFVVPECDTTVVNDSVTIFQSWSIFSGSPIIGSGVVNPETNPPLPLIGGDILHISYNGGDIIIGPNGHKEEINFPREYCAYAIVMAKDLFCNTGVSMGVKGIATVTPDNTVCHNTPELTTFTCTINPAYEDCWEIYSTSVTGAITPTNSYSAGIYGAFPTAQLTFLIRQKNEIIGKKHLLVEAQINNWREGKIGPADLIDDVDIIVEIKNCDKTIITKALVDDNNDGYAKFEGDFPCNTIVKVTHLMHQANYTGFGNGFDFEKWEDASGYSAGDVGFSVVVDMSVDRKIKGIFKEYFRLTKIGTYENNSNSSNIYNNTITWRKVQDFSWEQPEDIEVYDFENSAETGYGSLIYFKFNDNVEKSSVYNRIRISENSERVDLTGVTNAYNYGTGSNIKDIPSDEKQVAMFLKNGNKAIPKGEKFTIEVLNTGLGITNTSGEKLKNPQSFQAETEMPGIAAWIRKTQTLKSTDWPANNCMELITIACFGESKFDVSTQSNSNSNVFSENYNDEDTLKIGSCTDTEDQCPNSSFDRNLRLRKVREKVGKKSLIATSINVLDDDTPLGDGCSENLFKVWRQIRNDFEGIIDYSKDFWNDDRALNDREIGKKSWLDWIRLAVITYPILTVLMISAAGLVGAIVSVAYGILVGLLYSGGSNGFDAICEFKKLYSWGEWFGAKPSIDMYNTEQGSEYHKIDVEYKNVKYKNGSDYYYYTPRKTY